MASFRGVPRSMVLKTFVLFCSIFWAGAQDPQSAHKPHIIMIVADDLVSEVSVFNFFFLKKRIVIKIQLSNLV